MKRTILTKILEKDLPWSRHSRMWGGGNIYRHARNTASFYFVCPPLFLIFSILNMLHCYNSHESQPVQNCPLKYPEWMVPWRWHYSPASAHCRLRWDPAVLNLQVMATSVASVLSTTLIWLRGFWMATEQYPNPAQSIRACIQDLGP